MRINRCRHVNSKILRWARQTAGYHINQVKPFTRQQLEKWEQGVDHPTYKQLEKLAYYYHRPLVIFFFSRVPNEEKIEHSFRSLPFGHLETLPHTIRLLLRKGKVFQLNLEELTGGFNPVQGRLITKDLTRELKSCFNMKKWAEKTRELLGVDIDQQKRWGEEREAFQHWRDAITDKGVFIFKDAFHEDGYSGFCLYNEKFPLIFVNNSVVVTRQIFTLFHELAHLIFRSSHIDVVANDVKIPYLQDVTNKQERIEQLCNEFAGEFLLPTSDFTNEVSRSGTSISHVDGLAKLYSVSRAVVLRKMLTHNLIDNEVGQRQLNDLSASYKRDRPDSGRYPDKSQVALSYLGRHYVELVLNKYDHEQITLGEAADYLDIKPSLFDQLEDRFYDETL